MNWLFANLRAKIMNGRETHTCLSFLIVSFLFQLLLNEHFKRKDRRNKAISA
jgi:hypothetical protein